MAKFMLDGQEYCGGGGSNQIVKLTQAEYDALSDEKLSNNTIYLITDSGELTAENLFYDDTETGLGVNNVQDAIDNTNKKMEQNFIQASTVAIEIPEINGDSNVTISFDAPRSFRMAQIIDSSGGQPYVIANMWYDHGAKKMYLTIANISPTSKPAKTVTVYYVY